MSETENGRAMPIQMTVPRGTRKSLFLTEATIVLIMARTGRYAAWQRMEVATMGDIRTLDNGWMRCGASTGSTRNRSACCTRDCWGAPTP